MSDKKFQSGLLQIWQKDVQITRSVNTDSYSKYASYRSIVHFALETSSESETARQATESIKTTRAFRSTCVSPERNYGGVKPTPRLDQIQLYCKTYTANPQQSHFATFLYALMRIDAFLVTMAELL
jgi:hypothetical protein